MGAKSVGCDLSSENRKSLPQECATPESLRRTNTLYWKLRHIPSPEVIDQLARLACIMSSVVPAADCTRERKIHRSRQLKVDLLSRHTPNTAEVNFWRSSSKVHLLPVIRAYGNCGTKLPLLLCGQMWWYFNSQAECRTSIRG